MNMLPFGSFTQTRCFDVSFHALWRCHDKDGKHLLTVCTNHDGTLLQKRTGLIVSYLYWEDMWVSMYSCLNVLIYVSEPIVCEAATCISNLRVGGTGIFPAFCKALKWWFSLTCSWRTSQISWYYADWTGTRHWSKKWFYNASYLSNSSWLSTHWIQHELGIGFHHSTNMLISWFVLSVKHHMNMLLCCKFHPNQTLWHVSSCFSEVSNRMNCWDRIHSGALGTWLPFRLNLWTCLRRHATYISTYYSSTILYPCHIPINNISHDQKL